VDLVQKYIVHNEMKTMVDRGSLAIVQTSWAKPCAVPRCLGLCVQKKLGSVFTTLDNEMRGAVIERRRLPRRKDDQERRKRDPRFGVVAGVGREDEPR